MRKTITHVVGIDLGDRWSVVGGVDLRTGELLQHRRVRTEPGAMRELFESLPAARVVLETGTHSPWVSRVAERLGHQVVVGQARKLRAIWQNDRKSDDADADILWQIGHVHPELLAPSRPEERTSHGTSDVLNDHVDFEDRTTHPAWDGDCDLRLGPRAGITPSPRPRSRWQRHLSGPQRAPSPGRVRMEACDGETSNLGVDGSPSRPGA